MGRLRNEMLSKKEDTDSKTYTLTEPEINYLKLLNLTLQYHTYKQQLMSTYLYYISVVRLGYEQGRDLQFELDLEKEDNMLTIKVLPVVETAPVES
jgi:hypothetical protein